MTDDNLKNELGYVSKITGSKVLVQCYGNSDLGSVRMQNLQLRYVSVGSLVGTKLVDGRTLVLLVEEVLDSDPDVIITTSISGIYDEITKEYSFGTNTYPMIDAEVFMLKNNILKDIFTVRSHEYSAKNAFIGTYAYDKNVKVGYDPNILFGKHLGVFGNTGSGKTCTVVSIIQQYIRTNPQKDIKFIILDVNGEYRSAFTEHECEYIPFSNLRFHHTILDNPEYGRLFRASEGTQYPALRSCIDELSKKKERWDLNALPQQLDKWIDNNTPVDRNKNKDKYTNNQLNGYLRTMQLRIDGILKDSELLSVINSANDENTLEQIKKINKKAFVLDLQVSNDALDIILYMLFKDLYQAQVENKRENSLLGDHSTHYCLVLEEAHRYINNDAEESKLGSYYIDKLSREGRKFGIGLIISSQVPSMLTYSIVSQCNSVIMHKVTNRRDMEFLRNVLRISSDFMYQQMSALEKQHALVCGEAFPNDALVKINDASPLPNSNDPVIRDILLVKG